MKRFTYALLILCLSILCSTTSSAQWNGTSTTALTTRDGNVGIGLANPNAVHKLSVQTPYVGEGTAAIYGEIVDNLGPSEMARGIYGRVESGTGWAIGVVGSATTENPSNQGRSFGVIGVGGNATPGFNYGGRFDLVGTNSGAAIIGLDRSAASAQNWNGGIGSDSWAGYFYGNVEVTEKMGIGCTNFLDPNAGTVDYQLFVNGGIRALELHVDNTSWCDYVFENTYQLTSLEEVAKHIDENGHLHNTLSAAEIEANGGFELSEMTRNQQEKIEEIYLHLIDLNEQIKTLQSENEALKKSK